MSWQRINILKMYSYVVSGTVKRVHHAPFEEDCKHPATWWHCSVVQLHCNKQPGPKYIGGHFVEQLSPKTPYLQALHM